LVLLALLLNETGKKQPDRAAVLAPAENPD
jgi:hypothetical protein